MILLHLRRSSMLYTDLIILAAKSTPWVTARNSYAEFRTELAPRPWIARDMNQDVIKGALMKSPANHRMKQKFYLPPYTETNTSRGNNLGIFNYIRITWLQFNCYIVIDCLHEIAQVQVSMNETPCFGTCGCIKYKSCALWGYLFRLKVPPVVNIHETV